MKISIYLMNILAYIKFSLDLSSFRMASQHNPLNSDLF